MKRIITILILLVSTTAIFAQEFSVPKNYQLNNAEDYTKYEKDIIACFDWLMATPSNKSTATRKEAFAFMWKWISGSPTVTIEIHEDIVTFMKPNSELLFIFMGAWTKYALETQKFDDVLNGNLKGIEAVIAYYTKNKESLKKDKNVEKFIKMKEKGTLEAYITSKI